MNIDTITTLHYKKSRLELWVRDTRPAKFWPKSYGLWVTAKTMGPKAIYSDDRLGFAEKLWVTREYGFGGIWVRGEATVSCAIGTRKLPPEHRLSLWLSYRSYVTL